LRPAFDALYDIDDALADVVARATEPALAAIKLAWWRERLEALDGGDVPAEPRLQAAASILRPCGIAGAMLAGLQDGYAELLQPLPDPEIVLQRGADLFHLAGHLLDRSPPSILQAAGRLYAAGQLKRLARAPEDAFVITEFSGIPKKFRPLTGMAALALRDLQRAEPEATPGRAFALLRHRWTGRIG
jgi:phytoene synthase